MRPQIGLDLLFRDNFAISFRFPWPIDIEELLKQTPLSPPPPDPAQPMRTIFLLGVTALILLALPSLVVFGADLAGYGSEINKSLEDNFGVSHRIALGLPAAIALFCIPPLIILLYFLRLKRKPIPVASTFLWKKSVEDLHVNRLMQWMRRNVLLLLQLLAVLTFLYAALGPRTHGAVTGGRHYILMIDNSASMNATDVKPTRLDWAKEEAIRVIDAATDADPGMVIVFNSTAEIRQSYTTNREELKAAVRGIQPTQFPTRIDEALSLAASLSNPNRSTQNEAAAPANPEPGKERTYFSADGIQAEVHLLSDGRFPAVSDFALANLSIRYPEMPSSAVAMTSDNIAVVGFEVERDPDDARKVMARASVFNYRDRAQEVKLVLEVLEKNEKVVGTYGKTLTIPGKLPRQPDPEDLPADKRPPDPKPGEGRAEFLIPDVGENSDVVMKLRIDQGAAPDSFKLDDETWAVLGVSRKAKVMIVTPGNKVLRNYFETESAKKLAEFTYLKPADLADAKDYLVPARDGKYDLVIFDRCGPPGTDEMPTANTLFLGYPVPPYSNKPGDALAVTEVKNPSVRGTQGRHPLLKNLRGLDEVRIADCFRFPKPPDGATRPIRLIEGDRELELLVAIRRGAFTDLVLTFPLVSENADGPDQVWHSDWPTFPSFVLFLRNVLMQLGNVRGAETEESLRPGALQVLRLGTAKEVFVAKPGEKTGVKFERGNRPDVAFSGTDTLGVYTAEWGDQSRRFAVNLFDAEESNLAPQRQFKIGDTTISAGDVRKQPLELWKYAIAFGLAVVLLEWWIYNRRVQI